MTTIVPVDAANSSSGTGGAVPIGKEITVFTRAMSGGNLAITTVREANQNVVGVASTFIPGAASGVTQYLNLSDAKSDLGVPMTAAAGTPSGTVGISRTAGTSMQLVTESSANNTKTDKAVFEFNLPDTYQAGQNINLYVNCSLSSTGSLTSATLTPTLYTETAQGLEAALTPTPASATTASLSAADMAFVLPGQNLVPGQHVLLELVFVVITTGGGVVGNINSVRYVC